MLCCCKCEVSTQKNNAIIHSAHGDVPDFRWYGRRLQASEFRIFGCRIEALIGSYLQTLQPRTEMGYFLGTTSIKSVIRYWIPEKPKEIQYCTTARFFKHTTKLPDGQPSSGSQQMAKTTAPLQSPVTSINITNHPLHNVPPQAVQITLPPLNTTIGITLKDFAYNNLPYIQSSSHISPF